MKTSYIIVLIVVIIGLLFFLSNNPEEQAEVTSTDDESSEVTESSDAPEMDQDTSDHEDMEMSDMSDDEMMDESDETTEVAGGDKGGVTETATGNNVVFEVDSFSYGYSMEEIRVKEGDTVTINLTNSNGFHDWVVDEFDAATEKIQVGQKTSVTFVADKKGTFEYYCSVGAHRAQGMVGNLIVE